MAQHIARIRGGVGRKRSPVSIFVERNLGFESEHHKRALQHLPGVDFYVDEHANRVGVLTTETTKHAMAQLVVVMLAERRVHVLDPLLSAEPQAQRTRFREQMETYSMQVRPRFPLAPPAARPLTRTRARTQVKQAENTFQKERIALSGKVGGMKDDVCICFQLACYYTQLQTQRAVTAAVAK